MKGRLLPLLVLVIAIKATFGLQVASVARIKAVALKRPMGFKQHVVMASTNPQSDQSPDYIPFAKPRDANLSMSTLSMCREIASVGIPALGGMLIDPLMSLVDTACVGQVSSLQLASLAPCTSIYQFVFTMFFFLPITTTTLVAANPPDLATLDADEVRQRIDFNEKVVSCATLLALIFGFVSTTSLFIFSKPLMTIAGCSSPEIMFLGENYLKIRALGLPFVLVATVLQGASIGRQDAWTPLKIFLAAGMLNLVGDIWLTLQLGWGVTGSALATLAAQVAATTYYAYKCLRVDSNNSKGTVKLTWKGLPDRNLIKSFGTMGISLLLKCITTMGCYSLMTRTASTMGSLSLAAHQVTLQVWWLLSYFPEPASTAAQSLVARDIQDRPWRVPKLVKVLYSISALAGILVAIATGIVLTVPQISRIVVADSGVRSLLVTTAAPAMMAQVLCSIGSLSDGLAVSCGDFSHLPFNSAIALFNLGIALRYTRDLGIAGVWISSSAFFASRVVGHFIFSKKLREYLTNNSMDLALE